MPLVLNREFDSSATLVVWEIEDEGQMYRDALNLSSSELGLLEKMKPFRQKEWLAKRYVLKQIFDHEVEIVKDKYGKPFIAGHDQYLSISHSHNRLAVILHTSKVGVDIQDRQQKIVRIAPKFILQEQIDRMDKASQVEQMHFFWGAKESMYKAYGKKQIDFKKHLLLDDIDLSMSTMQGRLLKDDINIEYTIHYEILDNYFLVYAIEN